MVFLILSYSILLFFSKSLSYTCSYLAKLSFFVYFFRTLCVISYHVLYIVSLYCSIHFSFFVTGKFARVSCIFCFSLLIQYIYFTLKHLIHFTLHFFLKNTHRHYIDNRHNRDLTLKFYTTKFINKYFFSLSCSTISQCIFSYFLSFLSGFH